MERANTIKQTSLLHLHVGCVRVLPCTGLGGGNALLGPERTDPLRLHRRQSLCGVVGVVVAGLVFLVALPPADHIPHPLFCSECFFRSLALVGGLAGGCGWVGVGGVWLFFEKCIVDASIWFVLGLLCCVSV